MSALDIPALRALCDAATGAPWSADPTGTVCADVDLRPDGAGGEILPEGGPMEVAECYRDERAGERAANAAFVAAARTALPVALDELDLLSRDAAVNEQTMQDLLGQVARLADALRVCEYVLHRAQPTDAQMHAGQQASGAYCTDWTRDVVAEDIEPGDVFGHEEGDWG